MRRLIAGVALVVLIVGAAALGFAARGHATSKRPSRNIQLHWGDHLQGNAIKVSCGYSLGANQEHPHLYCFGPTKKEGNWNDPELMVDWTSGAVQVTRCWNDCAGKKEHLLTARR
jgi:hypothetical protein